MSRRSSWAVFLVALGLGLSAGGPVTAKDRAPAPGKVHTLTTSKHGRSWCLFVPSKYSKKKAWPLVISSHGRGGSGEGEMRPWQGLANRFGFIVACPDMVTATNHRPGTSKLPSAQEDDEVLMEIFETVSAQFRVDRRAVMITGFSGGGNPSYHTGLRHPDIFTHICTRGGNFAPQQIPPAAVVEHGSKRLHIYIFFGENDHVLITGDPDGTGQAYAARDALKQAGYANVTFEKVPAMKHESRPAKAADWLAAYLEAHKKQFKEADKRDALLEKAREALQKGRVRTSVGYALKARDAEVKHDLLPASGEVLDALEAQGRAACAAAQELFDAGDVKGAVKAIGEAKREFKGLPAGDQALELEKVFKAS